MGRPREHDTQTREALLDAAEEQLAAGGTEAVSVRGVADAVGTTTRAVYSLFGSKDALLGALASRGYRLLTERVSAQPATDDPAADIVTVAVQGFRPFALAHPHLFRLTFERVPAAILQDDAVNADALASYQALHERVVRAQEAGALMARPAHEVVFALHALCQGLASNELMREPPPVGSGFWRPIRGQDLADVWRLAA